MPAASIQYPGGSPPRPSLLTALLPLWLGGVGLRLTILAVPPVIPLIHDELNLSATQIGILTGLPSMLFAFAAVPGSLLIARLGVRTALMTGLIIAAIGSALRGALPDIGWLYAMTIAMGAGVAIMQVTLPPAVRAWLPSRIGFATAVYTNGLLIGEILPVALMLPLVLPLVGGSWQWGFVVWSVPVAVIALVVMVMAPRLGPTNASAGLRRRWWPDWSNALVWRLGIMLGTVNATYFATNAFLPDYLRSNGQSEWISAALTGLNVGQLPASFLLLAVAGRLERKAWPYVV
ncbi:MAG: MFS transporter, partial [Deltaproteobacteria bacterium]|nr:MFS transporter [Deltaproteobacteria bacterium]